MIRRLAIQATIGLVTLAPIVATAQGYGGGGYGNASVDPGYEEMLQYQMMMQRQQQLRLQQKKALLAKQKGQIPPSSPAASPAVADPEPKQANNPTSTKGKSRSRSTKAATTKTAPTPGAKTTSKAKGREKAARTNVATEP